MISNADNLGATLDPRIARHVSSQRIPFLMEVVEGTEADRKGGHIARRRSDGQLVLRETAQTPPADEESFRDFRHWRYYNTNNLWVDLRALAELLDQHDGAIELPLIVNHKTVDPRDSDSPEVLQLESAMGAAIGSFDGSQLLCVPRTRFVPVKTTDDLLVLRSDVYTLTDQMLVQPVPERSRRSALTWSSTRASTSCWTSSRRASRPARHRCARPSAWSSAATSRSAPAWWSGARSSSSLTSRWRSSQERSWTRRSPGARSGSAHPCADAGRVRAWTGCPPAPAIVCRDERRRISSHRAWRRECARAGEHA